MRKEFQLRLVHCVNGGMNAEILVTHTIKLYTSPILNDYNGNETELPMNA